MIYADFEAITEKVSGCTPNNNGSYTEAYQKHKYCSYAYKVVCCYDDQYTKPVQSYRGENAVNKLLYKMLDEVKYCRSIINYKFNKDLFLTFEKTLFKNQQHITFVEKNTTNPISVSGITVTWPENIAYQLTKLAIWISNLPIRFPSYSIISEATTHIS